MEATVIAWLAVLALLGGLGAGLYKYGKVDQVKDDANDKIDDAQNTAKTAKEITDREKAIDTKPLPDSLDAAVDRLPE